MSKQEVLSQVFEESNKTFGIKNRPRTEDPSMFDMLSWKDKEQPWDFKKKHINPDRESEAKKYSIRIAHDPTRIQSEAQDNFRKLTRLQNGVVVQELNQDLMRTLSKPALPHQTLPPQQQLVASQSEQDYRQQADYYPKIQTMYRDQYQVKDIQNHDDLVHQLELNAKDFKGHYKAQPHTLQDQNGVQEEQEEEYVTEDEEGEEGLDTASAYNSKKMNTKFSRKAKRLDPNDPEDKKRLERRRQRINKMKATTRFMADTSFTTYFGKPAFGPYGYRNVQPTVGGIVYGQHMLSHNVQPHRSHNHPQYAQSYNNALRFSQSHAEVVPEPPRNCKEEDRLNPKQVEELKQRNPLTALPYEQTKKTITDSKGKMQAPDLTIKKPDLVNSLRFASEEGSISQPIETKSTKQVKQAKSTNRPQSATMNRPQSVQPQHTQPQHTQPQHTQPKHTQLQNTQPQNTQQPQLTQPQSKQPQLTQSQHQPQLPLRDKNTDQVAQSQTQKPTRTKKVGFKKLPSTEQKKKVELDDSLNLPDKSQKKFMEELMRKKEKANRLTGKVNEFNPSVVVEMHPHHTNRELQDIQQIDDMNPPHLYMQQLQQEELNPKYQLQ